MIDCSKCPTKGACCCVFDMKKGLILENKNKFQIVPIKIKEFGDYLRIETKDERCIFLNRNNLSCAIYDRRPKVCEEYGSKKLPCPYFKPNGRPRSEASRKQKMRNIIKNIKLRN